MPTGSPTAVPTSSPTVVPTPAAVVDDEPDGSLIGSITIISDEEPECAGAGNCEEVVEDGLEGSLGRNGTVNVTDVTVTSTAADAGRRVLLFVADGDVADNSNSNRLLRGSRQLQEEAAGNQTETEIEYESSPDTSSNMTEAQQAAEQINALAETGIADLLDEMGLPPDTEVELGVTKFVQSEFLLDVFLSKYLYIELRELKNIREINSQARYRILT